MNPIRTNIGSQTQTIQQWENNRNSDTLQLTLHSLEESASLYSSAIDTEAINLQQSAIVIQGQNNTLITQIGNIIETGSTLLKVLDFAYQKNTTIASTGITVSVGLAGLFTGNLWFGIPATVVGINEIKKLVEEYGTIHDPTQLIGESKAGIVLIKQLQEFQLQSLATITDQLNNANGDLEEAKKNRLQIKKLAVEGSADAQNKKKEALDLAKMAVRSHKQAVYNLQNSRSQMEQALKDLAETSKSLEDLIEQAEKDALTRENVGAFVEKAKTILFSLQKIQKDLAQATKSTNDGLSELRNGTKQYAEALNEYHNACQIMQAALNEIRQKAQVTEIEKAQEKIEVAKNEVDIAKRREQTAQKVADEARENLEKAQLAQKDQWGTATILAGGVAVAAAAPTLNPVLALGAGASTAAVFHYIHRTHNLAKNLFKRDTTVLENEVAKKSVGTILIKYDEHSTGSGGKMRDLLYYCGGKQTVGSRTEGSVVINLGKPYVFRFSKSQPRDMMDANDILILGNSLRKALETKQMTPQQILKILDSLDHMPSDHGNLMLIRKDSPFMLDLRDTCNRFKS